MLQIGLDYKFSSYIKSYENRTSSRVITIPFSCDIHKNSGNFMAIHFLTSQENRSKQDYNKLSKIQRSSFNRLHPH